MKSLFLILLLQVTVRVMVEVEVPDKVAPGAPPIARMSRPILITWDANEESDLSHYNIYLSMDGDSVKVDSVKNASYLMETLSDSILVQVTAVDSSGNESEKSELVKWFVEN